MSREAVADFLAEAIRDGARGVALVAPGRAWSFVELDADVDRRAEALRTEGAAPGRAWPLTVEADPAGIVTLLALWRVGATPVPLNPRLTDAERGPVVEALSAVRGGAQALLWTSGTSGRPRGVVLTADNLRWSVRAAAGRLGLGPEDVWLASLSLAHVGGLALVARSILLGGTLAAWGRFGAASASAALLGAGMPGGAIRPVTHMSVVPTQMLRLLDERGDQPPPRTFRCALIGGAQAPLALVRRALDAGWPLALTYGMTEMTSQVATATPEEVREKPDAVGKPLDGVRIRIVEDGEVLVRGPTLAAGYVGTDQPLADREGWYHTGDLGELDADGDLRITGRREERIVSGGVNVDALEVEAALRAHPAVRDVCVVGLPDAEWGEIVAVAVVGIEGEFDLDELDAWVRERLSPAKRPRRWHRLHRLPLNVNGKVDRERVRAAIAGGA